MAFDPQCLFATAVAAFELFSIRVEKNPGHDPTCA